MNDSSHLNNTIEYGATKTYPYAAVVPFSIIGLSANILLFYILIKHTIFSKTTYYLLRISVISDIICNFVTAAGYLMITGANRSYLVSLVACRCLTFIILSSYGVSIMTLCLIAIDRYFIIIRPLSPFYRRYKRQFIGLLLALAAIIVFGSTWPVFMLITTYPDDTKLCDFRAATSAVPYYMIISTITLYIIPALILTISYSKIVIYMRNYVRPGESVVNPDSENRKKKKFIRMLISIAAAYLLISWPFFATCLGIAITRMSLRQVRQLSVIYHLLAFLSFTTTAAIGILNPFLYFKFDSAIRLKAKIHLSAIYNMVK